MKGIPASEGIGIAKALVLKPQTVTIETGSVENVENELKRLQKAIAEVEESLNRLADQTRKTVGEKEADVFEAHVLFLSDPEWLSQVKSEIENKKQYATAAVSVVTDQFIHLFEAIEDEYLRARASDLKDVTSRLIRTLLGMKEQDLSTLSENVILIAKDLEPSQTASLDREKVKGFITEIGNSTSHTAIIAKTLGIPAVIGVGPQVDELKEEVLIGIDGGTGEIFVAPTDDEMKMLLNRKEAYDQKASIYETVRGQVSKSKDGKVVEVAGNIGKPKDAQMVMNNDGEGIGLFRSEFVFMDRDSAPTEEEQFEAYKTALQTMDGKPVIIRTLDAGGDKHVPYLNVGTEMNPFLGYRAIRICLRDTALFKTQLRALYRASVHGNLKIMIPMIANVKEIREAKKIAEKAREELRAEGYEFKEVPLGIMIEIPSAAVMADLLIEEVDFFSIGTNDLTQYTLAADRMNENLGDLYATYDPAVLRLVKGVINAGRGANKMVGMCGEAAGDPLLIPIWLGMGLHEFSVSPSKVLGTRYKIGQYDSEACKALVARVLKMSDKEAVKNEIETFIQEVSHA